MNTNNYFILSLFVFTSIAMCFLIKNRGALTVEFYLRVRSWWWMLLIIMIFTLLNVTFIPLFVLFIAVVSALEIATVSRMNRLTKGILLLSLCLPILFSYCSNTMMLITGGLGLVAVLVALSVMVLGERVASTGNTANDNAHVIIPLFSLIVLLSLFLMSFVALISIDKSELAVSYMLYLIFTTQFNDVIQYFIGKKFGKHQLCPKISPNKTVEGAFGSCIVITFLATVVALLITPLETAPAIAISFSLTVLGVFGDVFVSWFKRVMEVKDMGTLIPGHGGMMDRIDSLLLSTPIFFLIVEFLINS